MIQAYHNPPGPQKNLGQNGYEKDISENLTVAGNVNIYSVGQPSKLLQNIASFADLRVTAFIFNGGA